MHVSCQFSVFLSVICDRIEKKKNLWSCGHWQKQRQHMNAGVTQAKCQSGALHQSVSQSEVGRVLLCRPVFVASYLTVALLCGPAGVCCSASSF